MQLIADSGSTKTDWCYIKQGEVAQKLNTSGLNPYFYEVEQMYQLIKQEWNKQIPPHQIEDIIIYAAGASTTSRQNNLKTALQRYFTQSSITVHHDLLGAARALCANQPGIVGILGTGSNTCFYDGTTIIEQRGGQGYVLSDEGSGNHMGRVLMNDLLNNDIPHPLRQQLEKAYSLDRDHIIKSIYQGDNPSRFLAQFAPFLHQHIEHPYVQELIKNCFQQFMEHHIIRYSDYKKHGLYVIGSIAYHFAAQLKNTAQSYDVTVKNILKQPIDALVRYHQKNQQSPHE